MQHIGKTYWKLLCLILSLSGSIFGQMKQSTGTPDDPLTFVPRHVPMYQTPCVDSLTLALSGLDNDSAYTIQYRFDNYLKSASLAVGGNTLTFGGIWSADSIMGQNRYFMTIQFRLSNEPSSYRARKVLLCISGGKLHAALDILSDEFSYSDSYYAGPADSVASYHEALDYHVDIDLAWFGSQKTAKLYETRDVRSKRDTLLNMSYQHTYELTFDPTNCIFYDTLTTVKGKYTFVAITNGQETKEQVSLNDKVPSLKLWYPDVYYFVQDGWYTAESNPSKFTKRE